MSSLQEISGLRRLLSRIQEKTHAILINYDRLERGEINSYHPDLTEAEVNSFESLLRNLSFRITGNELPSNETWEPASSFVRRKSREEKVGRTSDPPLGQHFYWLNIWVQQSYAYLDYLEGYTDPAGVIQPSDTFAKIYDVALSFAGEDRQKAKELAELLRSDGYKVFYDDYERAQLWGSDLYAHLSDIYKNKARYCIMFLSANYAKKLWTNHERRSAQARAFKESSPYILPVRLDDTEIPGILETTGYLDLRQITINEIHQTLRELLGKASASM